MVSPVRVPAPAVVVAAASRVLAAALVGLVAGLLFAVFTPAKVEIAGSSASLWLRFGQQYDQFGVDGVLTGKRATGRAVLGEPVGVQADLDLDASELTDSSGAFNIDVLPAYIQAYSDPQQLVVDARRAVIVHFVVFAAVGAGVGALLWAGRVGYRAWRAGYDRMHWPQRRDRRIARAYRAPERRAVRRAGWCALVVVGCTVMPASSTVRPEVADVHPNAIFAGTPLDGIEVDGLLRPALEAAGSYIETYFDQTNSYYDELRSALDARLAEDAVALPGDDNSVHLGFVTDRHCNIGMDRVIVALLDHYGIHTLVSAGDDAFSGSFGFEAACTRNLADKSAGSDIEDVFVGGNHDSPQTIADEKEQGITTLTGKVVTVAGLRFVGVPDPRTSRYGQGIVPAGDAAQRALLTTQGTAAGRAACTADGPVIAVLHDPLAGRTAIDQGCGKVVLALDGHTHKQASAVAVGDARQFTGGSAGGAPTESAVESTFASRLTVGPLNHDAWLSIVTVDRSTARLRGITSFHITPDQKISVAQQRVD